MKVFKKIVDLRKMKEKRDTLVWCYGGNVSMKKVKLQSLHKQYENLITKNNKKVSDYIPE